MLGDMFEILTSKPKFAEIMHIVSPALDAGFGVFLMKIPI
jgi:hypothetical protein